MRLTPLNWFKPSSKIFSDRSKAVLLLRIFYVFVLSCVCYVFVRVCLYVLCGHLLGKVWPLGSRLSCLHVTVSLSLSDWYPGSCVVLDCIDSWSLQPYLLLLSTHICNNYRLASGDFCHLLITFATSVVSNICLDLNPNSLTLEICFWKCLYWKYMWEDDNKSLKNTPQTN